MKRILIIALLLTSILTGCAAKEPALPTSWPIESELQMTTEEYLVASIAYEQTLMDNMRIIMDNINRDINGDPHLDVLAEAADNIHKANVAFAWLNPPDEWIPSHALAVSAGIDRDAAYALWLEGIAERDVAKLNRANALMEAVSGKLEASYNAMPSH